MPFGNPTPTVFLPRHHKAGDQPPWDSPIIAFEDYTIPRKIRGQRHRVLQYRDAYCRWGRIPIMDIAEETLDIDQLVEQQRLAGYKLHVPPEDLENHTRLRRAFRR
ncbi:hypothetical protein SLS62_009288 [Diatrype stigma]|uniref:Uncharacterized protein n=1 Tax=Diatrype stigma TaxID=117547 RepID=A0AAN9UHG9_9PEZI